MAADDQDWVVAPDEARYDIAIGDSADVSPEVMQALQQLADTLGGVERDVEGYASGTMCSIQVWCQRVSPCAMVMKCTDVFVTQCTKVGSKLA